MDITMFMGTDNTTSGNTMNQWYAYASSNQMPDNTSTWYTTNGATWEITGLQLEVGSVATDFEHRSFEDDLRRCQRYYELIEAHGNGGIAVAIGQGFNTRKGFGYLSFKVTKRVAPTAPNINIAIDQGDTTHDCFFNTTTTGTTIRSSSSTSIGNADITSDGWTNAFSAEL